MGTQETRYATEQDLPAGQTEAYLPDGTQHEDLLEISADIRAIDRFAVIRVLGEGGMGQVFACYDEELDRRIAVKVLNAEFSGNEYARDRFMREAQAMARLSHPNVVQVYQVGEFQGHVYVAMEYVRGVTMRDWLDEKPRTTEEVLSTMLQAGRGLKAAHDSGIIHRDFKPENVMVGADGRVRVLDFGLAGTDESVTTSAADKSMDSALPQREKGGALAKNLTMAGTIMGTPAYMAPEQHQGLPTHVTTDVFSYCVVLFESLFGYRPFKGENQISIAVSIQTGERREPPSDADVDDRIVLAMDKGLAVSPGNRWPAMAPLLAEIDPTPTPTTKNSRGLALAAGLGLLGTLGLGAVLLLQEDETPPPAVVAEGSSVVDELTASARRAGGQAHWVYPPEEAPHESSYQWVLKLQRLEGDDDAPGDARAGELRSEFAQTLLRLGDEYWGAANGKVFARDFYAQALMFDDTIERARERSGWTSSELADLRSRAAAGEFSELDYEVGQTLVFLAEVVVTPEDVAAGEVQVDASARVEEAKRRMRTRQPSLARLVDDADIGVLAALDPEPEPEIDPDLPPEPDLPLEPDPLEAETGEVADTDGESPDDGDAAARREKARADSKALVKQGDAYLKRGDTDAAKRKYFAALKLWSRNARAANGLRRIFFDAGAYEQAVDYAEKAVKAAARNKRYVRYLGEAYFKVGRYKDARDQFQRALDLGDETSRKRLDQLERLGH